MEIINANKGREGKKGGMRETGRYSEQVKTTTITKYNQARVYDEI